MRYCECGRELEKYQKMCSECAVINRSITNDICSHNYEQKPERIKRKKEYLKEYRSKHLEDHKKYMKDYRKGIRRRED